MDCVTIYTDASMCQRTGCGGWGAWVKFKEQSFKLSGAFKQKLTDPTTDELMAIANAVKITLGKLNPHGVLFVIVTDSANAKSILDCGAKSKNKKLNEIAKYTLDLIPSHCSLKVNKVKAHSKKDGKRSYINNLVDGLAVIAMKELRKNEEFFNKATGSEGL